MFKQELFLLSYNKDVVCIIDEGHSPVCKAIPSSSRRNANLRNNDAMLPTYDPYIPRTDTIFYNCSSLECKKIQLHSITQITDPEMLLKSCYMLIKDKYECETIRYNHFKNIDKVTFLTNSIKNKKFYMVDCLVYEDSGRVCHKKDDVNSHTKLIDIGTIVRPKQTNILSQDEFVCEESQEGHINCDIDPYISIDNKLKLKESINTDDKVLLKTGNYVVSMTKKCLGSWCGYSGLISKSGRRQYYYEPPGGKMFRCYYAKKQQICKEIKQIKRDGYNWLDS